MDRELRIHKIKDATFERLVGRKPRKGDFIAMSALSEGDLERSVQGPELLQMWTLVRTETDGELMGDTVRPPDPTEKQE